MKKSLQDKKREKAREEQEKEKSSKISIKEGAAASAMVGLGESYISPLLVAMNATPSQIAMLTSVTNLVSPSAQLLTPKLIEKKGRKKISRKFVLFQALMWLPLIASIFLFLKGAFFVPLVLIFLWVIYAFFGNVVGPAWNSWMGDLIKEKERGKYFSIRNSICETILLLSVLVAAFWLDITKKAGFLFYGFVVLFFLAMCFRIFSFYLLGKQYEPPLKLEKGYYFSFLDFVKRMKGNNFGRFVMWRVLFAVAVQIAGPFFIVYALRELKFSYALAMVILTVMPILVHVVVWPFLGKLSDKYGNLKMIKICGILACAYPILWIFSRNPYYLIFVPMLISGIGWAGINLATANFIFDAVTPQRRSLCFAYFSVLLGMGVFVGASIGGILVKLPISNIFLLLFFLSGIFRAIALAGLSLSVREVRHVEKGKSFFQQLFRFSFFQKAEEFERKK